MAASTIEVPEGFIPDAQSVPAGFIPDKPNPIDTPSLRPVLSESELDLSPEPEPFAVARERRLDATARVNEAWEKLPETTKARVKAQAVTALQTPGIQPPRIETKPDAGALAQIGAGAANVAGGLVAGLTTPETLYSMPAFAVPEVAAPLMTAMAGKAIGEATGELSVDDPNRSLQRTTELVLSPMIPTLLARGAIETIPKMRAAEALAPRTVEAARETIKTEKSDASKVSQATAVHGDVRKLPVESAREVPAAPSSGGVQPQAGGEIRPREQAAAPAGKVAPDALTPAIEVAGKVFTGEDHVSAYANAKANGQPDTSGAREGFVDAQGKFLSREEAAQASGLPTETEPGKLHSSDLPEEPAAPIPETLEPPKPPAATETAPAPEVAYDAAKEAFRKVSREFREVREKYRAKEIGDDEFLEARKRFDQAQDDFDKAETAYIAAKNAPEPAPTAVAKAQEPAELTVPVLGLRESEATQLALGKMRVSDPTRYANVLKFFGAKTPGEAAKAASARFEAMRATEPPRAGIHLQAEPLPPGERPLGIVSPTSEPFWHIVNAFQGPVENAVSWMRDFWRGFSMKTAPKITDASRTAGEAGARYAQSFYIARAKGLEFAHKVMSDTGVDPVKFGTALVEDNLRGIQDGWNAVAQAATDPTEKAAALSRAAGVRSVIGATHSPFKTEAEYQGFLADPQTQAAIARHKQLWAEQKDPLYRKANDLDPETPLASRGRQTGARINLKALQEGESGSTALGGRPPGFRQLATLKRKDPFARLAKGTGAVYEGNYPEIMAHGFEREFPVAAQHEFIRELIDSGDAAVSDKISPEDFTLKDERTTGRLLTLNPWRGKMLQVRNSLINEFDSISGLDKTRSIPILTPLGKFLTRMSVQGLAEGTTHSANLMMEMFTGLGPTSNPLINALLKATARSDILIRLPRVIMRGFSEAATREEMLSLQEIGAAKEPYTGLIARHLLNRIDRGVRLTSKDIYEGMAKEGWVENTETDLREFINQVGNYNKRLQPWLIRRLRETQLQPFATAGQTFNVMGLRRMVLASGAKATSTAAEFALKADIAAGWIGGIVLVGVINKLLSGNVAGPQGTPLGSVGWKDEHGKLKTFNVARLMGYERGPRITGLQSFVEAKRSGLSTQQAVGEAGKAVASTGLGTIAGPLPRALVTAGTGLRPTQPWTREVAVVPPTDSMNPMKTQVAANIEHALKEMNPALSSIIDMQQGKPLSEIAQRQFSRYTPRAGKTEQFQQALPRIATKRQLIDYADDMAREARKLPLSERRSFVLQRYEKDSLDARYRKDVETELKRKGVFKYE